MGIKRWFVLLVVGMALLGLGVAVVLLDIYRNNPTSELLTLLSLRMLPRWLRATILGASGLALVGFAIVRLNRALLAPYVRPGKPVVEAVAEHRRLGRGPRIVTLGGGTGLSTLLRGLKAHSANLTAVVTVADDGGSSGRLRQSLGLPPPGDLRNCLAALCDDEDLITQLFQYRFAEGGDLDGHSFGNLFIAALAGVAGSFDRGVMEAGRVLRVKGQVLPSTLATISLVADKAVAADSPSIRVAGESRIPVTPGEIRRVQLEPGDAPAHPEAIRAILNADMIVLGPGSLYTSVLPSLLIPDLTSAIRASKAFKVYVCNVATQRGETDGYDCLKHVAALEAHVGRGLVDVVIANDRYEGDLGEGVLFVRAPDNGGATVAVYRGPLVDSHKPWRHDADKLADVLIRLLEERTGPLDASPSASLGPVSSSN